MIHYKHILHSGLSGLLLLVLSFPLSAATIVVNTNSGGTGGPNCTLRDAITSAETDTATGGCSAGSGPDTIELPANADIVLYEIDNELTGSNGLPAVTSEIIVNGNDATVRRVSASNFRFFFLDFGSEMTLNRLTLQDGVNSSAGGAIHGFNANLTINQSNFVNNQGSSGGAIFWDPVFNTIHPWGI